MKLFIAPLVLITILLQWYPVGPCVSFNVACLASIGGHTSSLRAAPPYQCKAGLPGTRPVKSVLKRNHRSCGWYARGASPTAQSIGLAFSAFRVRASPAAGRKQLSAPCNLPRLPLRQFEDRKRKPAYNRPDHRHGEAPDKHVPEELRLVSARPRVCDEDGPYRGEGA